MKNYRFLAFIIIIVLLITLFFISFISGSIDVSFSQLISGFFNRNYNNVNLIKDLRLPRILISIMVGASLSVSGLLLQASLKNPLLDPSILGVSGGANLFLYVGLFFTPNVIIYKSLFSILGGLVGFLLIYLLSKGSNSNITIILIGIAISLFFNGLLRLIGFFQTTNNQLINNQTTLGMKSWNDVYFLLLWVPLLLIISFIMARVCNIFFLEDNIVNSLGVNIQFLRLIVCFLAVFLASVATSVAGVVTFLALLIPHIAKILIGKNNIYTIPFTALLGSVVFLMFDTLGRVIFSPIEIPADIIMLVIGGPCFLFLIKRGNKYE